MPRGRIPSPAVERKHRKVKPIRDPTLFEMEKLKLAGNLANLLRIERPYSEPGVLVSFVSI
jgi:hypothetical protein